MGTTQSDTETDVDTRTDPTDSAYEPPKGIGGAVRNSVLLKIAIGGVLFVLIGAFLDSGILVPTGELWSIWAAIFATWGAGLILAGLVGYGFLWWKRS
ncbi:hypothetical protein [Natrinema sp. DC36]|uniref:hypothetical protein n=1 Tax=Natrinema sp. DC36 TaxID=2878680 RepID=UPI001CEFD00C|nr:hypothetical protein [Natrinema sp. DC36]